MPLEVVLGIDGVCSIQRHLAFDEGITGSAINKDGGSSVLIMIGFGTIHVEEAATMH